MAYQTTPEVLTSQRIRRAAGKPHYLLSHADADFSVKNVITCQACEVNGDPIPGYCVDAGYFTAARFTDQATAEARFKANFIGISGNDVPAGEEEKITIFSECDVEYELGSPAICTHDDWMTWTWNATDGRIEPQKMSNVGSTATNAIARLNMDFGPSNVNQVIAVVNRLHAFGA